MIIIITRIWRYQCYSILVSKEQELLIRPLWWNETYLKRCSQDYNKNEEKYGVELARIFQKRTNKCHLTRYKCTECTRTAIEDIKWNSAAHEQVASGQIFMLPRGEGWWATPTLADRNMIYHQKVAQRKLHSHGYERK